MNNEQLKIDMMSNIEANKEKELSLVKSDGVNIEKLNSELDRQRTEIIALATNEYNEAIMEVERVRDEAIEVAIKNTAAIDEKYSSTVSKAETLYNDKINEHVRRKEMLSINETDAVAAINSKYDVIKNDIEALFAKLES